MIDISLTRAASDVSGLTICIITGGYLDTRLHAAYNASLEDEIDHLVIAMKNGGEARLKLRRMGWPKEKILVTPETYFRYTSYLGDLTAAKTYLQESDFFYKIGSTKIVAQQWCAPRFWMTAWRLGYPRPSLVRAEDPRPIFSRKSFDILEEWLTDVPAYLLAMINPDFYLRSIEPRLQKARRGTYNLLNKATNLVRRKF